MFVGLTALSVEMSTKDLTFAEIDSALKHKISHRGQALAVLQENLSKII